MRLPLVGDVLDHVLHFTCCKDLEIVSTEVNLLWFMEFPDEMS